MPRALWKGSISFGLVNVPVSLFPAEKPDELHFSMLDNRDKAHIKYHRVNEATGKNVPPDQVVKAYEYEPGDYVVITDEDFKKASVEATQTVEIEDFVDRTAIDYVYFDKPYYLVPGKRGDKGYVLLRETLKRTEKIGIARVVIRTREHLAALIPEGNALLLDLIRFKHELRDPAEFAFPGDKTEEYNISDKEMTMAVKLVESMSSEWRPENYRDEYRNKLMSWIERKAREGERAVPPAAEEAPAEGRVLDMMGLLKQSVEESRSRRESGDKAGHAKSGKRRKAG
jgi:DNA end-binding protein Ku